MRKTIIKIETYDSKKLYEYPSEIGENPQLWQVTLKIAAVDVRGYVSSNTFRAVSAEVYLERETLEMAKILPQAAKEADKVEPVETAEDLLVRLLETLGYYPTE